MKRNIIYIILIVSFICIGLIIRKYNDFFGSIVGNYAPDTLWAIMVFFILRLLIRSKSNAFIFVFTIVFSYLIELSQLYHSPWIDYIRNNKLAALVLGKGFLWSDIICYSLGACSAFMIQKILEKNLNID